MHIHAHVQARSHTTAAHRRRAPVIFTISVHYGRLRQWDSSSVPACKAQPVEPNKPNRSSDAVYEAERGETRAKA